MNKHLIFGIHGNNIVRGNSDFFRKSLKESLKKCGKNIIDIHIEGISQKNIEKNDLIFKDAFLNRKLSFSREFEDKYNLACEKYFNETKNEMNSLLYVGHFTPDLFGVEDVLINNSVTFNLIPEKQNIDIDFSIWKIIFLRNNLDNLLSSEVNTDPVLVMMDYLKTQTYSLYLRDNMLNSLIKDSKNDVIVLRGFLHSPSASFINKKEDFIYEDLIDDEVLKCYKLFLKDKLDNESLLKLSRSYLETYKRVKEIKSNISFEEYKRIILNN
jgi:hypothetical protein